MHKICFTISLFHVSACLEHHVFIVRRSEVYYTASGIITPVGGCPVHRLREESCTCFKHYVLTIRRSKLYYTATGIVTLSMWPSRAVLSQPVHRTAT